MPKICGVEFASFQLPRERRLQTLAVTLHMCFILVFPIIVFFCSPILLFTPLAPIPLAYFLWIFWWDRQTPERGGRWSDFLRRLKFWHYVRDYFPISLVKTAELTADRNYIFGVHPHGILSFGASNSFCTEATGFSKLYPGITPHLITLGLFFFIPILRDYVLLGGACASSHKSLDYLLSNGTTRGSESKSGMHAFNSSTGSGSNELSESKAQRTENQRHPRGGIISSERVNFSARAKSTGCAVILIIGGAEETFDAHPGSYRLTLRNRKGFVRKALQHGADLVPVFFFGENELFKQLPNDFGSSLRRFQEAFKRLTSWPIPVWYGRGIFQYTFGCLPHRHPIATVIGAPIHVKHCSSTPSKEQVDALHEEYCRQLIALFEAHKEKYGVSKEQRLEIV